ncbi:MAG: hypothetical protein WA160_02040 [Pseudobdellovibrio sp.]
MKNFRLVILDYAKNQIENPVSQRLLSDLFTVRQKNFERTDPNYIVLDKHDMTGTHALIFDTNNIYEPKLIFAMRVTFQNRARQHKINTPVEDLTIHLNDSCKMDLQDYISRKKNLIEINSLFVDEAYSFKNSGLRLSDIGSTAAFLQISRMGYNHFACCTNEKYKAHRLVENIGRYDKSFEFVHPTVPNPHLLMLVEEFNIPYLQTVYLANKILFDSALELSPKTEGYKTIQETILDAFKDQTNVRSIESWAKDKAS